VLFCEQLVFISTLLVGLPLALELWSCRGGSLLVPWQHAGCLLTLESRKNPAMAHRPVPV
jgi:hypothetical protein